MTWIPGIPIVPGPAGKQGYWGIPNRKLSQVEGDVKHSAEGGYSALISALFHGTRQASWHLSMRKDGRSEQHYPVESVCWHCGEKGDMSNQTAVIGNVTLYGIEHEGVAGEPLTAAQVDETIRISQWLRDNTWAGANPPELGVNLWEHNFLSATACPSNRIPWSIIIPELDKKENDMSLVFISPKGRPEVYLLGYPLEHIENPKHLTALIKAAEDSGVMVIRKELPANHPIFTDVDKTHRPN